MFYVASVFKNFIESWINDRADVDQWIENKFDGYIKDRDHSWTYISHGYSDGSYHMATNTAGVLSSVLVPPVFSWLTVPACVEVTRGPTSSVATVRGLAHGNKDSRSAFIHLCISCWAHHWCAEPVCSAYILCVGCVVSARLLQLDPRWWNTMTRCGWQFLCCVYNVCVYSLSYVWPDIVTVCSDDTCGHVGHVHDCSEYSLMVAPQCPAFTSITEVSVFCVLWVSSRGTSFMFCFHAGSFGLSPRPPFFGYGNTGISPGNEVGFSLCQHSVFYCKLSGKIVNSS